MSDDNIPLEIQIERSAVESLLRFRSAVEFATDYCVRHAQPNKIMANEDFSNNFYMAKTFATTHPEIVAILRGHPLYPALSKKVTVPQTYLMQLWNSLTFVPGTINDSEFFYFKLTSGETFRLRFDIDLFRRAIGFPLSNAYPDKPSFESVPSESTIFEALNNLGYEGRFNKVSEFKRNLFAKRWCILFMILNRCLTHSYSGIDSLTKPVAQILYGVAYHQHFDFAHIIWTNLIKIVSKKQKYAKYTPYIRFLSIILDHFLAANPQIPALTDDQPVLLSSMKYTQDNTGSNIAQPAHIPQALLVLADRNDKAIMRYRELVARMEPVEPQASAPRAHSPPGEGSSVRGSKRKSHEGKRKGGDLGDSTAQERCQKQRHDRQEQPPTIEPIIEQIPQLPQTEPTDISVPAITLPLSQDPTPSIGRFKSVGGHKKKKLHKRKRVLEVVAEEAQVTSTQQSSVLASGSDDAKRPFTDAAFAFDPIEPASDLELPGGHEGVVEKSKESERSGREIRQKERVSPPRTSPKRRVTTSATATHVLRQSIEEVAGCPLVQAQTHPSHSVSQQREIVSCVHRDSPHNLPASHLETQGIELRDTPPQSRRSTHADTSNTPRTLSIESSSLSGSVHLRDVAGTSEGSTASTVVRGSMGNPTNVITTPALNVGHSTRLSGALVVSTERLSGTEHSFTLNPAFASHFTSMTCAQVHSHSSATMAPLHISQSQTPTTPSTSQTQSQTSVQQQSSPSSSQSQPPLCNPFTQPLPPHLSQSLNPQTINFRDLKALFYAQLLIRQNRTPIENAILSLMNAELSSNTQPQIDLSPVLSRLDQIDRRLATLECYEGLYLPNDPRNQNPR